MTKRPRPSRPSVRARMPLVSVASEAWRNLCTGTTRALTFALTLAATLGVLVWADVGSAVSLADKVHTYVAAGASTHTLVSTGNIDAAACERLISSGYVDAAGALRGSGDVRLSVLPSNPLGGYTATPGLLQLIAPNRPHPGGTGVYISPALSDTIAPDLSGSATTGRFVAPVTVLGIYPWPDDGRPTPLQYALLGAAPPAGAFDQCWVRSIDPTVDPTFLLRSTLIRMPTGPSDAEVAQLNPRLGESLTASSEFASRPTRLAWLVSLGIGALLAAAAIWLRRLEFASARELGVPVAAQLAGTLLETLAWALTGMVLSVPLVIVGASRGAAPDRATLVTVGLPILIAGITGSAFGSIATTAILRRRAVTFYLRTR